MIFRQASLRDIDSLTEGKHSIFVCLYSNLHGFPDYSIHRTIVIGQPTTEKPSKPTAQPTVQPTIQPPRVAPTIPPIKEESSYYCGDESCNGGETCRSCPLDCGLCTEYSCSSQYCTLPFCQCASTHHPSQYSLSELPQFVTITWDDAQTPTTFPYMMKVSRLSTVYPLLFPLISSLAIHLVVIPK